MPMASKIFSSWYLLLLTSSSSPAASAPSFPCRLLALIPAAPPVVATAVRLTTFTLLVWPEAYYSLCDFVAVAHCCFLGRLLYFWACTCVEAA